MDSFSSVLALPEDTSRINRSSCSMSFSGDPTRLLMGFTSSVFVSMATTSVYTASAPSLAVTMDLSWGCLLYTSDAADDLLCVDLGGRRIIKKKNTFYRIP